MLVGGYQRPKTKKGLKKGYIKYRHKITNVPVLEMGLGILKSTLANHKMGPVQGIKMVPKVKIENQ